MRRPRTALIAAILGSGPLISAGIAQQFPSGPPPQTRGADPAVDAMASARSPRALLRNGLDYLDVGEFERALPLLREAEPRKAELSPKEQKALAQGIADAQKGLRAAVNAPGRPSGRGRGGRRPGALALAPPSTKAYGPDPIQLTSGTVDQPPAPPAGLVLSPIPRQIPDVPASAPVPADVVVSPAPPSAGPAVFGAAPDRRPAPAIVPDIVNSTAPAPPPEPIRDLATTPPEPAQAPAIAPEPAPGPAPAPAPEPAPAPQPEPAAPPVLATPPATSASPAPVASGSMPVSEPIRVQEPVGIPEPRRGRLLQMPTADPAPARVQAPTTAPEPAPTPAPAPAPSPTEPAARTAPEPSTIPASATVIVAEPPASGPAQVPAFEPPPAAETSPGAAPEPIPSPADPAPAPASAEPAPAPTPTPAPASPAPAASEALPPLPGSAPTPAPRASANPRKPIASSLSPEVQREVERIARRQEETARRDPNQQPGTPPPGNGPGGPSPSTAGLGEPDSGTSPDLSGSRLELPRAPSPTEARAIRPIPVPEEFVPLPPRQWQPSRKFWTAPATCHMPLYFQNAVLERYGQSAEQTLGPVGRYFSYPLDDPKQSKQRNYILAPIAGAALFATQIAALPINAILDPPWEAEFDLGYYRPGDRIPPDTTYFPQWGVGPPFQGRRY